ncbi:EamA family transporter [Halalkalicoccus jeotgali]|uniref:Probable DMT superfamily transporter, putative n=1 Tax=Halalkalicoccus jeotgali (strain DSM 18796 / CECT 7217 / JCM 14584 / KCTC 4019 / B3) TaxID=795797 RepID=D8J2C6_HALJB|nr:EamA family transporter [Halalkalicoccus jeotgali]ADJ14883.1 probable DMT superfamily transporter, putative [Halalkalicoccus jeotgali B3]ELY39465.1 putative DMT superfamily transporter [Halalkalicoccus jeotgali B3]
MNYLLWALVGLVAYTFVAPLMSIATTEVPSNVAVIVSNSMLVVAAFVVVVFSNEPVAEYLTHPDAPYMYAAGICLAVGILAYYRALSMGPVSVVVPIFGMFLVTSSLVGFVALDEAITARKVAGIGFAVLAVYLTAVE